ncbi:MAG: hypothetical protein SV377_03770 [Halobacteria archaeon]|nr:hypothetical protein [Halobacteria archaeon]
MVDTNTLTDSVFGLRDKSESGEGGTSEDSEKRRRRKIDRSPARMSSIFSISAGLTASVTGSVGTSNILGFAISIVGVSILALGLMRGTRRFVTVGSFIILLGLIGGSVLSSPTELLILGIASTVIAWDLGENAISIGKQLGREADTKRAEYTHAAGSILVGAASAGIGYAIYTVATGGQPIGALVFLLLAGIILSIALGT